MIDSPTSQFHPILGERHAFLPEDASMLLFGAEDTRHVVAIEPYGSNEVLIFRRDTHNGRMVTERRLTSPWLITSDLRPFRGRDDADVVELRGQHPLRFLITFASWEAYRAATARDGISRDMMVGPPSLTAQYQMRTGLTLFKDMEYGDLRRMQIDLETLTLDPLDPDAGIIMISVRQGDYEEVLVRDSTEEALIERLNRVIASRDPDVIEGHNICRFDFPYLLQRAMRAGVPLRMGRNGSPPRLVEGFRRQQQVFVHGRHVIDTYVQIQRFDVAGKLSRYGLKDVVRDMGLERADRTFVDRTTIAEMWRRGDRERDRLAAYALDDVRDVDMLSRVIMPTEFYQTQMLPMSYQRSTSTGTGKKIDDLMLRSYLAAGHSVPRPAPGRAYPGGYVELVRSGSFGPVVKCDVESLYPSIMISEGIASDQDVLGAFPLLLRDLTRRRIEAKRKVETTAGEERATWNGLQGSFKILINSFYGYLGFGAGAFNDYQAAEHVTVRGQQLIQDVVQWLRDLEAVPIEVDTDGVYFSPPDSVKSEEDELAFIRKIGERLPAGINLAHDGRYRRMLSLKIKTYALVDHSGAVTLTGSALRSRSLERCFQEFIRDAAQAFLAEAQPAVRGRYFDLAEALQKRDLSVEEISQWTMLREDRIGNRARIKALLDANPGRWRYGERVEVYERNDGKLGFAADYNDDENTVFLLRRLREVAERFRPLYEDDAEFDAAFPLIKPTSNVQLARERKPTRQLRLM